MVVSSEEEGDGNGGARKLKTKVKEDEKGVWCDQLGQNSTGTTAITFASFSRSGTFADHRPRHTQLKFLRRRYNSSATAIVGGATTVSISHPVAIHIYAPPKNTIERSDEL
ncbi:unnamed protein product [Lactuca virosa]|uniref:Uncharacterized protein n=1 Tax=Lactuca virosa TaxID=75947 RepID=A0AAU9PUX3_9ASTR|nr:unnamed protein product [Lactuca virosa]